MIESWVYILIGRVSGPSDIRELFCKHPSYHPVSSLNLEFVFSCLIFQLYSIRDLLCRPHDDLIWYPTIWACDLLLDFGKDVTEVALSFSVRPIRMYLVAL